MRHWDHLRSAYEVAKTGTVSAAAQALNLHRATVIRHIDDLEQELGLKLFQRHGRGYTMTEAGQELLRVTSKADAEFNMLKMRSQMRNELSGEFVITSLEFIAPLIVPILQKFLAQHPALLIKYVGSEDLLKLEYGQAHIAIRSGDKPAHPDYVVKNFMDFELGLFAHHDYISQYGLPNQVGEFSQHKFVMVDNKAGFFKASINQWLANNVPARSVILASNSHAVLDSAILNGLGIGVMLVKRAAQFQYLQQVNIQQADWHISNWLVTHGDLHRSEKVQQFLKMLAAFRYDF